VFSIENKVFSIENKVFSIENKVFSIENKMFSIENKMFSIKNKIFSIKTEWRGFVNKKYLSLRDFLNIKHDKCDEKHPLYNKILSNYKIIK
jgi:hypothetical protein